MTNLKAYVLRYWETEFSQLKPPKNRSGNRTYRQKDIEIILNIKDLLYAKKFTIEGARSVLKQKDNPESTLISKQSLNKDQKEILKKVKNSLEDILKIISE